MKKPILFIFTFFFIEISLSAQHCPFDGSSIIVIKVTDNNGKPVNNLKFSILLHEIDNPTPDSCSYAEGVLAIPFNTLQESLFKKYDGSWQSWAIKRAQNWSFIEPGYYAVVLNQAQFHCMIKEKNDYNYRERKFEIRLQQGGLEMKLSKVPPDAIYKLCTEAGDWSRIKAIEIKMND